MIDLKLVNSNGFKQVLIGYTQANIILHKIHTENESARKMHILLLTSERDSERLVLLSMIDTKFRRIFKRSRALNRINNQYIQQVYHAITIPDTVKEKHCELS